MLIPLAINWRTDRCSWNDDTHTEYNTTWRVLTSSWEKSRHAALISTGTSWSCTVKQSCSLHGTCRCNVVKLATQKTITTKCHHRHLIHCSSINPVHL